MPSWFNSDVGLDDSRRFANFLIPARYAKELIDIAHGLRGSDQPDRLCLRVKDMITEARPDLADCMLGYLSYDYRRSVFVVMAVHQSFAPVRDFDECPTEWLEPDDRGSWRARPSMI